MLKKYKPFLRASAMDLMAYKFNILIWVIVTIFEVACLVFLWLAVYSSSEGGMDASINGFTYKEMIAYFVLTTVLALSLLTTIRCGTSTKILSKEQLVTMLLNLFPIEESL